MLKSVGMLVTAMVVFWVAAPSAGAAFISQHEAITIARAQFQGDRALQDVTLRHSASFDYYEVVFMQRNGRVSDIRVDATTGAVIDMEYYRVGEYGYDYRPSAQGANSFGYPASSAYVFGNQTFAYNQPVYNEAVPYDSYGNQYRTRYRTYDPYFSGRSNGGFYDDYYNSISRHIADPVYQPYSYAYPAYNQNYTYNYRYGNY